MCCQSLETSRSFWQSCLADSYIAEYCSINCFNLSSYDFTSYKVSSSPVHDLDLTLFLNSSSQASLEWINPDKGWSKFFISVWKYQMKFLAPMSSLVYGTPSTRQIIGTIFCIYWQNSLTYANAESKFMCCSFS